MDIDIYTDGSCLSNPGGKGGWAFIVISKGKRIFEASGHEFSSTSNRMELLAIMKALEWANSKVRVVTDSKYALSCLTKWCVKWEANNWQRKVKKKQWVQVKNRDLIEPTAWLLQQNGGGIVWVPGHKGNRWNNRADMLAGQAARQGPPPQPRNVFHELPWNL